MSEVSRRGFIGGAAAGTVAATTVGASAWAADTSEDLTHRHHPRLRNLMSTDHQWATFLAEQDLVWRQVPTRWYEGPFLGNGRLGTMIYQELGQNSIRFEVQHSEVQDHRPEYTSLFGLSRLYIGHLTLEPVGKITGVDWRLDVRNAELRGTVSTDKGTLRLRVVVHNDRSLLLAEITPSRGERGYRWQFHPADAISPRMDFRPYSAPPGYTGNPPAQRSRTGEIDVVVQPMVAGGQTATAYRETRCDGARTLLLNVSHSFPATTAEAAAVGAVRAAARQSVSSLLHTHRRWWNAFYPKSFLSVPDQKLQSFYWIQLYKIASGARADAPVMATSGPWLVPTPWTATWWNLNVQLEYWLIHGSNHLELDAVRRSLDENRNTLVSAVPEPYRADSMGIPRTTDMYLSGGLMGVPGVETATPEVGNLTWALHNVWLSYRHTMDDRILAGVVFPLLRRAINYYLHFLTEGADGRLHLPLTQSPEYGNAPDCNYDLSLIRWGCRTLLDTAAKLGLTDSLAPKWREVLAKLVDYPVDADGFMIGAGVPFAKSHRHYSHMLMVYPLYLYTGDQPDRRAVIEKSLSHWVSFEGALQGYTFTGAASISSQLGKGNDALHYLRELLRRYIKPTTMYQESGPVVETPLSAAQSMHDMLCQSWGDLIRIFPAVPDDWQDVTLHDFRTQGAFLVSAVRRGGMTRFVRVRSEKGAPCRLRHSLTGPVTVAGARHRDLGGGVIEIDLRAGQEAIVYTGRTDFTIAPVRASAPSAPWGLPSRPAPRAFTPLDLSALYTGDGIATASVPANFDGKGFAYPAEALPPAGPVTLHGVPFTFPGGDRNYLLCAGQTVPVPPARYAKVWFLAAATTYNAYPNPGANYVDGASVPMPLTVTEWSRGSAAFNDVEAITAPYRYGPAGREDRKVSIYLQVAELDPTTDLVSLALPTGTAPELRVFAISLEKA